MATPIAPVRTARAPAGSTFAFRPLRTLRFALIVAAAFTLLGFALSADHPSWRTAAGWLRMIGTSIVFAIAISFTIDLLFMAGRRLLGARLQTLAPWQRALFHWGTPMLGLAIAWPLATLLTGVDRASADSPQLQTTTLGAAAFALLIGAIFYGYFAIRARQLRAEQQATKAQLRLLQAQMEPHFLFNTLANVQSLIDSEPATAKRMLESFIDYLRCSLTHLRSDDSTLGDELAMAEAYLTLMRMRMAERLDFRIAVEDESLRQARVPPLLLQPLIENAVHHGLECKIEGGTVTVSARAEGNQLVLDIEDDGLGILDPPVRRTGHAGNGVALANLEERLTSRYGGAASFTLAGLTRGARATLRLPLQTAPAP